MKLFDNKRNKIDLILNRSSRAVCGPMEREITVKNEKVAETKRILKSKGYFIVGTSENGSSTKKIWFNPVGSF